MQSRLAHPFFNPQLLLPVSHLFHILTQYFFEHPFVIQQASGRKGELADEMAAVVDAAAVAADASQQATQNADAVRAKCAEARGNKKRKKPLTPDLADELVAAELAEETTSLKAKEATNDLTTAKEELSKLGSASTKSYNNDVAVSVEEVVDTTSRILRIVKFLWEENGELTLAQLIEVCLAT